MKTLALPLIYILIMTNAYAQQVLTLESACQLALKHSIPLAALKTSITTSDLILHERWRDFLPQISLQYTRNDDVTIHDQDMRAQSLMGTISYDIFTSRRSFIAYSIAQIEATLATHEYTITRNAIILSTKQKYYTIQKLLASTEVYNALLQSLLLQKDIITRQYALGMATELEQIQVDGKITEAQYNLISTQNQLSGALQDFAIELGIAISSFVIPLPSYPETIQIPLPPKEHCIALAMTNRNELKKGYYKVIKSQKEYELARFYYLPKIQLFASYGYTGSELPLNKKVWNIGISVTGSLFGNTYSSTNDYGTKDNGATVTTHSQSSLQVANDPSYVRAIVEAESSYIQAQQQYEQIKQSIAADVSKAYDAIIEYAKKLSLARKEAAFLEKQATIENQKVSLGDITRYDVLKTLVELSQARLRVQESITQLYIATATLENAIGVPFETLLSSDR